MAASTRSTTRTPATTSRKAGRSRGCAFRIVNDLLEAAGSRERAYQAYEWDVWFLTAELFELLRAELAPPLRPFETIEQPPWHAQEP